MREQGGGMRQKENARASTSALGREGGREGGEREREEESEGQVECKHMHDLCFAW